MNDTEGARTAPGARIASGQSGDVVRVDDSTVSQFSHQLRALLTSVSAAADYLMTNDPDPGVEDEMLGIIAEQTNKIDGLLDDFLVVARRGDVDSPRGSAVNLYHIARDAVRDLAGEAQSAGAWLVLDAGGPVPPVVGRHAPLRQAVVGTLRGLISVARPGERVVAALEDARGESGQEIVEYSVVIQSDDPRLESRIAALEPADMSVEAARSICEQHGGTLRVLDDRPGLLCSFPAASIRLNPSAACSIRRRAAGG